MFLFVLLVLSESQFKMKYPFYYARLSTIKNVQSGLDKIGLVRENRSVFTDLTKSLYADRVFHNLII